MAKSDKNFLLWLNPENGRDSFAVALGCLAGCVWWVIHHNNFVRLYWEFVPVAQAKGFVPEGFDGVYTALNLATIVVQSFCVGFVTSLFARHKPYRLAYIALLATFVGRIPAVLFQKSSTILMGFGFSGSRDPFWIILIYLCVYALVTGFGAFIPQVFKSLYRWLFKSHHSRKITPDENAPFASFFALGNSLLTTVGITILLSISWKTISFILVPLAMSLSTFYAALVWCALLQVAQAFTIGFCVARCVPRHSFPLAVVAGLLGAAIDAPFFREGFGLSQAALLLVVFSCGIVALGGAQKALSLEKCPVNL